MSTHAAPLPGTTQPVPVARQVARAAAGTLAVAVVVTLVGVAWATWGSAVSARVFTVTGDPRVRTADGVSLSTAPRTVAVPVLAPLTWSPADEPRLVAAGTGLPVSRLDEAALVRTDPARFGSGLAAQEIAEGRRFYSTPLGVVVVVPGVSDGSGQAEATFMVTPAASVSHLPRSGQLDLLRRLVSAWGVGNGAASLGARVEAAPMSNGVPGLVARLRMPGTDGPCWACAPGWGMVRADGTLQNVGVTAQHVVGTRSVTAPSAAAAFDSLRHRAGGTQVALDALGPGQSAPGPATAASLVLTQDGASSSPQPVLAWDFLDSEGAPVGEVLVR